jgi:hypothetical protein
MQFFLADIFDSMFTMPTVIFTIGGAVGIVGIVFGSVTSIVVNRGRERTKREIAAYVAEGSLDPDKAVAMLKAGEKMDS